MEIGIKITWSSYTPPIPYLRLLAALRHHAFHIAVPVFTQERWAGSTPRRSYSDPPLG